MKRTILILALMAFAFTVGHAHAGIRCGSDIISTGDSSFDVTTKLKECGEVMNKETIKKETTEKKETGTNKDYTKTKEEKMIERWYIRVKEQGGTYCYPLTFEEGILKDIGNWKKCD